MTSTHALILNMALAILAVTGWAVAGALWLRMRTMPALQATRRARDLADRLEAVVATLTRPEPRGRETEPATRRMGLGVSSPPSVRIDAAERHAPTLITVPDLSVSREDEDAEAASTAAAELSSRFGAIWGRADRGESAESIARATGQPIGTVELVLGLRRQARSGSRGG
jgi:hypothetical protein